ncbi:MAG: hypothetical protein ACRDNF_00715 [Streptosporangiaceae bacterium]
METLLSLEPRIAGKSLLEPRAEFAEIADIQGRCFETTNPTCYKWTTACIENTAVC